MIFVLDEYFTPEQREALTRRRTVLGPEGFEQAQARGNALVEQLLVHVHYNTPVEDPQVQDLVRRWDELRAAIQPRGALGEQVKASAERLWEERGEELSRSTPWQAEHLRALAAYLRRAREAGSVR